jgi:hypothetical protein
MRDVQVFLGFANLYRRFIQGYSTIIVPLGALVEGGSKKGGARGPFTFTEEAKIAFEKLKENSTSAPLLCHFHWGRRTRVEPDVSGCAIAAILSQQQKEGQWNPIASWSRKLLPAEMNYETHNAELLVIVAAFKHWRLYLEGSKYPVVVLSNHANLRYFMTTKELTRRQARWADAVD